jgi:hypothetical protein
MRVNDRVVTKSMAGTVAGINAFLGNNTRGFSVNDTICYARRRGYISVRLGRSSVSVQEWLLR